jgi:hypothetical protein
MRHIGSAFVTAMMLWIGTASIHAGFVIDGVGGRLNSDTSLGTARTQHVSTSLPDNVSAMLYDDYGHVSSIAGLNGGGGDALYIASNVSTTAWLNPNPPPPSGYRAAAYAGAEAVNVAFRAPTANMLADVFMDCSGGAGTSGYLRVYNWTTNQYLLNYSLTGHVEEHGLPLSAAVGDMLHVYLELIVVASVDSGYSGNSVANAMLAITPEPSTLLLLAAAGLAVARRRP